MTRRDKAEMPTRKAPLSARPLAIFVAAFVAACICWMLLPARVFLFLPAILLMLVALICGKIYKEKIVAVALIAGFMFGAIWCASHDFLYLRPARSLDRQRGEITVRITHFPRETQHFTEVRGTLVRDGGINIPMMLRLDDISDPLQPGDIIMVNAILYRADIVQGERIWRHLSDGIYLRGFASGTYEVTDSRWSPFLWPQTLNRTLQSQIATVFPADVAGFITAILTGDRSELDRDAYNDMRTSGIAHIVAVSGMHVSFLVGLIMTLTGKNKRSAFITLPVLLIFVLMTGARASVIRAAVMLTLLSIAPLLDRETDGVTSVSAALLFLMLLNPLAIAGIGLQLSFLAVLGILLATPRIYRYTSNLIPAEAKVARWIKHFVLSSISTSIGAILFTVPALAFHFSEISVYGMLTNLLTVWAMSTIFGMGLAALGASFLFLPFGTILAIPVALLVRFVLLVARGVAQFPMATLHTQNGYVQVWLGASIAIVAFYLLYQKEKPRPTLPVSLSAGLLVYALFLGGLETSTSGLTVTALDVGQGQSIVITTPHMTAMVDNGGGRGVRAGQIAAEYLFSRNIYHLDFLVLTHFHLDHINGVESLMRQVEVGQLIIPDRPEGMAAKSRMIAAAEANDVPVQILRSDTVFGLPGSTMTIFAPFSRTTTEENNRGLTVLKSINTFDVLITGDMYADMERRLADLHDLSNVEVLVVGHHGSRTSTSEELLTAASPRVSIISVGAGNIYGHPHAEVIYRLHHFGSAIYQTDRSGNITVRKR